MQNWRYETEQVVSPSTVPALGPDYIESKKAIDKWRSKLIRTTRSPIATGKDSAIVSTLYAPFKFPGYVVPVINGLFVRQASAQLTKFKVRTWWVVFGGNVAPDVAVDEMYTDSCLINQLNDVTKLDYAHDVLHDDLWVAGIFFPATSPTATQYAKGTQTGSTLSGGPVLATSGLSYTAGSTVAFSGDGHSQSCSVDTVGPSGEITGFTPISGGGWPAGSWGPYASTGTGTGATFMVVMASAPTYDPSTKWIGTEKTISAKVEKTDIPSLWKVTTKSTVMR
jgi:hypothetical protein